MLRRHWKKQINLQKYNHNIEEILKKRKHQKKIKKPYANDFDIYKYLGGTPTMIVYGTFANPDIRDLLIHDDIYETSQ